MLRANEESNNYSKVNPISIDGDSDILFPIHHVVVCLKTSRTQILGAYLCQLLRANHSISSGIQVDEEQERFLPAYHSRLRSYKEDSCHD